MFTMPGCTLFATPWAFSFPLAVGGAPAGGTGMALAPGPAGVTREPADDPGELGAAVPGDTALGGAVLGGAVPGRAAAAPVFPRSAITPPAPAAAASTATRVSVRSRERPRGRGGSGTCPYNGCGVGSVGSVIAPIKRYQPECYLRACCQSPITRPGRHRGAPGWSAAGRRRLP